MKTVKKSLSILELVVVVTIVVIAIIPSYRVFINAIMLNSQSQETALAVFAARNVMERIRSITFDDVPSILNNSINLTWAGGQLLKDEVITVTYPDGIIDDPMNITVMVNWTSRSRRHLSETFKTTKTRMLW